MNKAVEEWVQETLSSGSTEKKDIVTIATIALSLDMDPAIVQMHYFDAKESVQKAFRNLGVESKE